MKQEDADDLRALGLIDLSLGHPGNDQLPIDDIRALAHAAFLDAEPQLLQYGPKAGAHNFREALAKMLSSSLGVPTHPETLFVTAGASQALDLACELLSQPGDVVFVEEPTYFLALHIFASRGLRVKGIPIDAHGLDVEALEAALRETTPAFVYTIPTYQNPTGVTIPAERRKRLVELSQQYGFTIVADEVYQLLDFGAPPPPPMFSFDEGGNVVAMSSFSKILGPGLRLGWLQGTPEFVERLVGSALVNSGGGLNPISSAIVQVGLESGFQLEHLYRLRKVYRARADELADELQHSLPMAEFRKPDGGYFFWVKIPGVDAHQLASVAAAEGVRFQPGPAFSSQEGLRDYVRLSLSYYDALLLGCGVKRLANAVARVMES